jgi:putative mRNA 3-end processing factor
MAKSATSIVLRYPQFITNEELLSKALEETTLINEHSDRERALDEPSIIVTTAGMLNGGPVLDYITKLNKNSFIFLTGYQVEGTNGRMLLDKGKIMVHGNARKITTPVSYYDFSAHADKNDLYEYIKRSSPQTVVCMHGDVESTTQLAESLKLNGYEAYAPRNGDRIEIK